MIKILVSRTQLTIRSTGFFYVCLRAKLGLVQSSFFPLFKPKHNSKKPKSPLNALRRRFRRLILGYIFTHQRLNHTPIDFSTQLTTGKMKLIHGVLRSLAVGISPSCQGFSVARTLATSSAEVIDTFANTNSSETMEEFERSLNGDLPTNSLGSSFFQKLDLHKKPFERSNMNYRQNGPRRSGFGDGIDKGTTSLVDGLDLKLKDAATYFEYDVNEVEKDDYKFRPDVTFWPGNTYDVKDLDVTKPGVRKPSKRLEFEVTTKEALQKADFRNVRFLANFITEAGVIHKRSKTKISAKAQRKVAREIKTARAFGLMPFTTMGTKHFVYGRNMQDQDKDYEYEVYDHNFVDDAS